MYQQQRSAAVPTKISVWTMSIPPSKKKDVVLCLHGSRQTGPLFLGRIQKIQKRLWKEFGLECVAPDAPWKIEEDNHDDSLWLTWWKKPTGKKVPASIEKKTSMEYVGLDKSLRQLQQFSSEKEHRIVGIVGFSQGARLAHLLTLLSSSEGTPPDLFMDLQFVIQWSGYDDPLPDHPWFESLVRKTIVSTVPSLHVWGEADRLIPSHRSKAVSSIQGSLAVLSTGTIIRSTQRHACGTDQGG